ncbi:kinesin 2 [Amanita muscaria]
MATRRPAPRTAKPIAASSNAQPSRLRQAMVKVAASVQSVDASPIPQQEQSHAGQRLHKSASSQDYSESNIQVVIRCRRRSEREIQDNSPIIVTSTGAKSKELTIEAGTPVSSLGILQLPPTRRYNFDMVFGPEADQAMIYYDVVQPMLDEVLMGYNCTLFAYGQTGTGKTYTMQGDLAPTPMGNPSPNAGMIPRVLFRLFHELEKSGVDYSVKISFMELYNEELRDLLAAELAPPSGTSQPMGAGVKDNYKAQEAGLKIFDDASKKGVFIQGLEEIAVKDSRDALALLTKGSQRRQIAATKFNDHSSRSHSVFSITVHTKETSSIGDDLLKVGKLNLVDLAGSENIGRSGAENKRAREAGMINQSLLTLGRVINALVDKALHVPYRESKLTRLLQDSLGGHTKTCIVATISPARSNMEETLSTLDYALRAKSIRNKPEVNQRMSRNALLKDYIAEIERLKADILATREKNGIYFSEENWKQICDGQELQATELAEAKKQVEIVEKELRSVREEYDQSIALLKLREHEILTTRTTLAERNSQLTTTEAELKNVQIALEEETIIRTAHQHTETILDDVAAGLKKVTKDSLQDISGLFSKIARKQTVLSSNSEAMATHGRTISTSTDSLMQRLDAFIKSATQHTNRIHNEAKQFEAKQIDCLTTRSKRIEDHLQRVTETIAIIQSKDSAESALLQTMQRTIQEAVASLRAESVSWTEKWEETLQQQRQTLETMHKEGFSTLENSLKTSSALMEGNARDVIQFIEAEQSLIQQAKSLVDNASNAEIQRLRKQNQALVKLLDDEKQRSQKTQDDMVQRISSMLGDFMSERDRNLRQSLGLVHDENKQATEIFSDLSTSHGGVMANGQERLVEMKSALREKGKESKRTRDVAFKSLDELRQGVSANFDAIVNSTTETTQSYGGKMQQHTQNMSSACRTSFEQHGRAKRARLDTTSSLMTEVQTEYHGLLKGLGSMSHQHKNVSDRLTTETAHLNDLTLSYQTDTSAQLRTTKSAIQALTEEGTKDDVATGSTPRKRVWDFAEEWELTKKRDEILKASRIQTIKSESIASPQTGHPEGKVDDDDDAEGTARFVNSPTPDLVTSSESPTSFVSSLSSAASVPLANPNTNKSRRTKSAMLPVTLIDAKNVYITRGSRRK